MPKCPSEEILASYCAGLIDEELTSEIERHAEHCATCARRIRQNFSNDAWLNTIRSAVGHEAFAMPPETDLPSDESSATRHPLSDSIDRLLRQAILEPPEDTNHLACFGPYRILGTIGRGGMGIVLRAYEESLNRQVALKILRPELAEEPSIVSRFMLEARSAASLRHPNIVTVHAVGQHKNTHYLAMEYIRGETLADAIKQNGPMPTEKIKHHFRELLEGLKAAHEAGLIHRDIKPSNIMIDSDTHAIKITDFGLARLVTASTRITATGLPLGTPDYMSPEQAQGEQTIDARTDLYSAGVVLYEMITGTKPFKADTPSGIMFQIIHNAPPNPREIQKDADPGLASLAKRLMAKEPEHRFSSAEEALAALESGERIASPERRKRLFRRTLTWTASMMAIAIVLVALAGSLRSETPSTPGTLTSVSTTHTLKPDQLSTILWAGYDNSPDDQLFHDFGEQAGHVTGTAITTLQDGRKVILAGVRKPVQGASVFAFDTNKQLVKKWDFSPKPGEPFGNDTTVWGCDALACTDIDGNGQEEVIISASNVLLGPSRLLVFDLTTETIRSSYWQYGDISPIKIIENFFENSRPAVIIRGCNNRMCNCWYPSEKPRRQLADWNIVTTLGILDPMNMNGLGPGMIDHPEGYQDIMPYAYAFLNLPADRNYERIIHTEPDWKREAQSIPPDYPERSLGAIVKIEQALHKEDNGENNRFQVSIEIPGETVEKNTGRAILEVDKKLNLLGVTPVTGELEGRTTGYWEKYWVVLKQFPACQTKPR